MKAADKKRLKLVLLGVGIILLFVLLFLLLFNFGSLEKDYTPSGEAQRVSIGYDKDTGKEIIWEVEGGSGFGVKSTGSGVLSGVSGSILCSTASGGFVWTEESSGVLGGILDFASFKYFLRCSSDNQLCGFLRIMLAIIIFTLFYAVLNQILGASRRAMSMVVSIILAIIAAIFTPCSVLLLLGETYATIFALIIIGGPIIGILMLLFMTPTPGRAIALLKFLVVCFLIWLIAQIGSWASLLRG